MIKIIKSLRKVYIPSEFSIDDATKMKNFTLYESQVHKLAKHAASLISDGDNIILDDSTIALQIIPWLKNKKSLRIMTNSLSIINDVIYRNYDITLIMSGGSLQRHTSSLQGILTEQYFNSYTFDKAFIGADGFDINIGFTTYKENHRVCQAMCHAAKSVIVIVAHDKFGRKMPNIATPINIVDTLVTTGGITNENKIMLENNEIQVIIV